MREMYSFYTGRLGTALLVVRVVVGAAFIFHGLPKIADPAAFAEMMRLPVWLGFVAAWTEVIGGALLALGLLTPLAALFLAIQMVGALLVAHIPQRDPFVNPAGGSSFELAAVYLATSIAYLLAGPGAYSIDALLFGRTSESTATLPERQRGIA
jgi:putative oxidoreductase